MYPNSRLKMINTVIIKKNRDIYTAFISLEKEKKKVEIM